MPSESLEYREDTRSPAPVLNANREADALGERPVEVSN